MLNKLKIVLVLTLLVGSLSSCSSPLDLLTGGGTNVAANVPIAAGQEVEQTQGISVKTAAPSVSLRPKSRVETIDQSQTTNNELPGWVWIVFVVTWIVGWATDTPGTMLKSLFRRGK